MRDVLTIILGGGRGTRLFPLTHMRSKPAVPIGGQYRLIDVPISNCLHAGLHRIFVLTQFNSASLNRHVAQTYRLDLFSGGFVDVLAAEQTPDSPDWFQASITPTPRDTTSATASSLSRRGRGSRRAPPFRCTGSRRSMSG